MHKTRRQPSVALSEDLAKVLLVVGTIHTIKGTSIYLALKCSYLPSTGPNPTPYCQSERNVTYNTGFLLPRPYFPGCRDQCDPYRRPHWVSEAPKECRLRLLWNGKGRHYGNESEADA